MGLFDNIKGARGTEGGQYFLPGTHLVRIQKCKQAQTRMGKDFFVAECEIVETNNEDMKIGSSYSFFVLFDEYPELSLGNVADFMNAGMASYFIQNGEEVPEGFEVDTDVAEAIAGEENILVGTLLNVEAFIKQTRAGKDFTKFKWTPVEPAQVEKYANAA